MKLDRARRGMTSSARSAAIVTSTVGLAHALELVAEGVEDHETLSALTAAGCDLVQGYLPGGPAPAADLGSLLQRATVPARPS